MTEEAVKSKADYIEPTRRGRPGRLPPEDSARITRRITTLAVLMGLVFAITKFFVWRETHSVGILSTLVHSALDLFGAISSFIAVRYAARPPDDNYRFGRGKAESFSAVFQVCLIIFAAFHLLEACYERFMSPTQVEQSGFAIAILIILVGLTIWLIIAQSWAIRATGSIAVRGDRAHYIADMFANIIVIIGLLLTSFTPFLRADALVGILMSLWLFWTAFRVASLAWAQLMDQELPEAERDLLIKLALEDPRVKAVHDLRTRASGPHVHVQMRLNLDSHLSLEDAHDIVIAAEQRMMMKYKAADIHIHPHPLGCHETHGNVRFRSQS